MNGFEEIKLGALTPTRDLLYVKDTVNGFVEIAKAEDTSGQEINISTATEISVGDLAQKIINIINPDARIKSEDQRMRPEKSEVNRLLGDNKKLKFLTDWTQRYDLENGLMETIDWFRDQKNLAGYKANIYNV